MTSPASHPSTKINLIRSNNLRHPHPNLFLNPVKQMKIYLDRKSIKNTFLTKTQNNPNYSTPTYCYSSPTSWSTFIIFGSYIKSLLLHLPFSSIIS